MGIDTTSTLNPSLDSQNSSFDLQTEGLPIAGSETPLLKKMPCEHPCDNPCEQQGGQDPSCDDHPTHSGGSSPWTSWLKASLFNALDLCFDDIYQEPKTILILGGCRQLDLAQHLALILPAAEITLVDPDEQEVALAKAEICCRFKFVHAPLESLPFGDGAFDFTVAHHFFAYPLQWEQALSEVSRVTAKNVMLSMHRPWFGKIGGLFPGFSKAMAELGTPTPRKEPASFDVLTRLYLYARIKTRLNPFPWTLYMMEMRTDREERSILS